MDSEPTPAEVEALIRNMGLPTETPAALAEQLLKRSRQIAEKRGLTQRQALEHLVGLLRQGWAAKNKSET